MQSFEIGRQSATQLYNQI